MFATSDLVAQHVFQSAHGFGLGDHRVFVVDIDLTQLLGSEYSQLVRLPGRKLQAKRYRVRKAYNKSLRDNIRRHKLVEKYHQLYQSHKSMSPQEISQRINQLDREKTELMKCAESKCKRKCAGKLPNSPKVKVSYCASIFAFSIESASIRSILSGTHAIFTAAAQFWPKTVVRWKCFNHRNTHWRRWKHV